MRCKWCLIVLDIDSIRKKIALTARKIVEVRKNGKYASKLPGEKVATFRMLPRAADIFQRYTFDTEARRFIVTQTSDANKQLQRFKKIMPEEVRAGPRASTTIQPIEPISELEVLAPLSSSGPRAKSMDGALSELELLERKYASLVRKLMYASEFSILTAFAEVITPIVYCTYCIFTISCFLN